jgi:hypothetical protein
MPRTEGVLGAPEERGQAWRAVPRGDSVLLPCCPRRKYWFDTLQRREIELRDLKRDRKAESQVRDKEKEEEKDINHSNQPIVRNVKLIMGDSS